MKQTGIIRDWNKEKEEVDAVQSQMWFKPKSNTAYKITFLDDGSEEYQAIFDEKSLTRIDFMVSVAGGEYKGDTLKWSVNKGGKESLFGMLVYVFCHVGGAKNNIVDVAANGEGRNRRYVLKQFNDLVFQQEDNRGGGLVGAEPQKNMTDGQYLEKGV